MGGMGAGASAGKGMQLGGAMNTMQPSAAPKPAVDVNDIFASMAVGAPKAAPSMGGAAPKSLDPFAALGAPGPAKAAQPMMGSPMMGGGAPMMGAPMVPQKAASGMPTNAPGGFGDLDPLAMLANQKKK